MRVTTTETTASWTLAGSTAVADASAPRCGESGGPVPSTTAPPTPTTTEPGGAGGPACGAGERALGSDCVEVRPVQLVLVDNVLECTGRSIAVFGAHNPNEVPIDATNARSSLAPTYLDGTQPELVLAAVDRRDDDAIATGLFAVGYVGVVTWTVSHDGLASSASAGATTARPLRGCDGALDDVTGRPGSESGGLATTGGGTDRLLLWSFAVLALGVALATLSRRPRPPRRGTPTSVPVPAR